MMALGVGFADAAGLVVYDPTVDTACWRCNRASGEESIHVGEKVASLELASIEMVLRHELLHRSLYHGFGEKYADRDLCNLTLDVCINRLLYEAYPDKMRKMSQAMYPAESKTTPIALADCSADATRLPPDLSTLWQSIWTANPDGSWPPTNPASLYFRLLRLRDAPCLQGFVCARSDDELSKHPGARVDKVVRVAVEDIGYRLPKGSDLGRALSEYTVVPIAIGSSRVEEFLKKIRVRRLADQNAAKVLEPLARRLRLQVYPAWPSRLGLVWRLAGISDALGLYWNREVANAGARMAIGLYLDVSGSMITKFPVVAAFAGSLKEYPLKLRTFDTEVRAADIDDLSRGKIKGGGGTDFDAPLGDLVNDREVEAAVLFTDGEARVSDAVGRKLRLSRKRLYVVYLLDPAQFRPQSPLDRYATSTMTVHTEN